MLCGNLSPLKCFSPRIRSRTVLAGFAAGYILFVSTMVTYSSGYYTNSEEELQKSSELMGFKSEHGRQNRVLQALGSLAREKRYNKVLEPTSSKLSTLNNQVLETSNWNSLNLKSASIKLENLQPTIFNAFKQRLDTKDTYLRFSKLEENKNDPDYKNLKDNDPNDNNPLEIEESTSEKHLSLGQTAVKLETQDSYLRYRGIHLNLGKDSSPADVSHFSERSGLKTVQSVIENADSSNHKHRQDRVSFSEGYKPKGDPNSVMQKPGSVSQNIQSLTQVKLPKPSETLVTQKGSFQEKSKNAVSSPQSPVLQETFTSYQFNDSDVAANTIPRPHVTRKRASTHAQRKSRAGRRRHVHNTPPVFTNYDGNPVTGMAS